MQLLSACGVRELMLYLIWFLGLGLGFDVHFAVLVSGLGLGVVDVADD